MTFAPATLKALGAYWVSQGGVNLGIVGDTGHVAKGTSYHLGADQLTATAYSRQTARDRAGLTNAASAIDLGRLDGTLGALRQFSRWLVVRAQNNAPGTVDLREIIYSDGTNVLRWDRERGYASAPQAGEADDTHLTHTHVSWYRDAEARDHTTAFRPYFEDAAMLTPGKLVYLEAVRPTVGKPIRSGPRLDAPVIRAARTGDQFPRLGDDGGWFAVRIPGNAVGYVLHTDGTVVQTPASDCALIQHELDLANSRIHAAIVQLGGTP